MGQNCCGGEKDQQNTNFDQQNPSNAGIAAPAKTIAAKDAPSGPLGTTSGLTRDQAINALQVGEKNINSVIKLQAFARG